MIYQAKQIITGLIKSIFEASFYSYLSLGVIIAFLMSFIFMVLLGIVIRLTFTDCRDDGNDVMMIVSHLLASITGPLIFDLISAPAVNTLLDLIIIIIMICL